VGTSRAGCGASGRGEARTDCVNANVKTATNVAAGLMEN
jgi:hypothetical protein